MFRSAASFMLLVSIVLLTPEVLMAQEQKSLMVTKTVMPLQRFLEGSVEAISQATVSAQTSGLVDQVMVDVGDHVPAGSVILKLVGVDQKEILNQAKAGLNEAVVKHKAEAQQFERVKTLYAKKLLSKANFDNAVADYNSAKARVANAQASLNRARQQVSYTEIKAAYDGVVSGRHVEIGEAVQPGMALMSGFDPRHLRVYADLPQSINSVVRNKPVVSVVLGNGDVILPSKVSFFPIADVVTGTIRMRMELPLSDSGLYPGQMVKVAVKIGEKARLLVPNSSIVYRSEISGIYVIDEEGAAHLRQVRTGVRTADQVEILSGLMEGETILMDPVAEGIAAVPPSKAGER